MLNRGWRTVVTACGRDRVVDLVEGNDNALGLDLDVNNHAHIKAAFKDAMANAELRLLAESS